MTGRKPRVRKGQGSVALRRAEFEGRFAERFYDPAFDAVRPQIAEVAAVAWQGYNEYRKSPRRKPFPAYYGRGATSAEGPTEGVGAERGRRRRRRLARLTGTRRDASCARWPAPGDRFNR